MTRSVAVTVLGLLLGVSNVASGQLPNRAPVPGADSAPRSAAPPSVPGAQPPAAQDQVQPPGAPGTVRPEKPLAGADIPPPGTADYRLGPGDIVKIAVYNNPDLATETEVSHDGKIGFPLIGEVTVGGLTRAGSEKLIAERLDTGGFVPKPHVNLLVTQYRSRQVSVIGEVNRPGKYSISEGVGLTDVLALAGGITARGSQMITLIQKDRTGRTVQQEINVRKLLAGTDASKDIRMGNDDVVHVPPVSVFYIYGEVRQPGSYPLAEELTVRQALSLGGGLTVRGTERGIRVDRKSKNGNVQTQRVQLTDRVQPNDVLHVPESWF